MIPRYHLNYCLYIKQSLKTNFCLTHSYGAPTDQSARVRFADLCSDCGWESVIHENSFCSDNSPYFSSSLPLHQILLSLPQLKKNVQKFFSYISSGFFIAYSKASMKAVVAARQADSVPASTAPLEFACDGGYQYLATRVLPAFSALSNA